MSDFATALPVILEHEGGYVDNPADKGGETNFGISLRFLRAEGLKPRDVGVDFDEWTPGCLRFLTRDEAAKLYERCFWRRFGCGLVVDQQCATKLLDACVNMGPRAVLLAQRAAVVLGADLDVDGKMGPRTAEAINALEPSRFLAAFGQQMADFYRHIADADPSQAQFLPTWLRRAAWPSPRGTS